MLKRVLALLLFPVTLLVALAALGAGYLVGRAIDRVIYRRRASSWLPSVQEMRMKGPR